MVGPRRFLMRIIGPLLAFQLVACGSSDSEDLRVVTIGQPDDPFEEGIRLSLAGQISRASTAEGLVAFDEQGRVVPALADRWTIADDGKSYIFRLRDGTWRDGSELTARSARAALRNAIRALRGTSLGLDLAGITEVREMAGRVIEIRLDQPMPHFLMVLAQPELGLFHRGKGAGPMVLEREDNAAFLFPLKPEELGMPAIRNWEKRVRPVMLAALPAKIAVEKFNQAELDLVLGGQLKDFPLTSSVGILRGTIQLDPVSGIFGLRVAHTDGFLSEEANREAIAMAIDRETLMVSFGLDGWSGSTRIVAAGLDGDLGTIGERWVDLAFEDRQALATARVSQWKAGLEADDEKESAKVTLRIAMPEGPGAELLFERLAEDLGGIGLETEQVNSGDPADLRLVDTIARYPHASWFLNRLSCKASREPCNAEADARAAEAMKAADPADRAALHAEAEAELTQSNVFIPFGPPIRWSLVRGDVQGFSPNPWGWHPLMPMALLPK